MKTPDMVMLYPLDCKKDEDGGLWYRIPTWLVRAFKMKEINLCGKVKFTINRKARARNKFYKDKKLFAMYYKENWCGKLRKEASKKAG